MATMSLGSDSIFFRSKEDIVAHVLTKLLANKKRWIGTEWELFCLAPDGSPVTQSTTKKIIVDLEKTFRFMGYRTEFIREEDSEKQPFIVGLDVKDLGVILPEPGLQLEFACSVCRDCDEIKEKNELFFKAISGVLQKLNHKALFKGHVAGYAQRTEGSNRSRSRLYHDYYRRRFKPSELLAVSEAIDATASAQVTIDAGADKFHEFFKALLLIEPAMTLYYSNSSRPYISVQSYQRYISPQVSPIVEIWRAKTAEEAIGSFVDHLMEVAVPFLPDPHDKTVYIPEPFVSNRPATTRDLMMQGRLSEFVLNNISGFFFTRPAFRKISEALIEVRGMDTQETPEKIAEIAKRIETLVYDDEARDLLLKDYAFLETDDIAALHHASTLMDKQIAWDTHVANMKMSDFVADIIARSSSEDLRVSPLYQEERLSAG